MSENLTWFKNNEYKIYLYDPQIWKLGRAKHVSGYHTYRRETVKRDGQEFNLARATTAMSPRIWSLMKSTHLEGERALKPVIFTQD